MTAHSIATAFFSTFYLWAALAGFFALTVWMCRNSAGDHDYPPRNPGDDLAEYRDSRLDALDFAARDRELADRLATEWEQRHRAQAPRRRGQDLPPVESIGDRSLDEIRREFGGDAA